MSERLLHELSSRVACLQPDALIIEAVVLGDLLVLLWLLRRNVLLHKVVGRRDFDALPLAALVVIYPRVVHDRGSEEAPTTPRCVINADLAQGDLAQKLSMLLWLWLVTLSNIASTYTLHCPHNVLLSGRVVTTTLVNHDVVNVRRHHLRSAAILRRGVPRAFPQHVVDAG